MQVDGINTLGEYLPCLRIRPGESGAPVLKGLPFSRLDLISCRNLLIYLNRDAQARVFETFDSAPVPHGQLFLGSSESVEDGSPLFTVLDKKRCLYAQRWAPGRAAWRSSWTRRRPHRTAQR